MTRDAPAAVASAADSDDADPVRRLADWDAGSLQALAEAYDTPLYVLDTERVRANYRRLRAAFERATDRTVRVAYATKANAAPAALTTLERAGADFEVASASELSAVRAAGVPPGRVQYTAVNPPADELDALVEYHETTGGPWAVTVGARDTVERLAERGYDGPLALRVRPDAGVGHHDGVVTGTDRGFGVALGDAPAVLAAAVDRFEVVGLHAHVGSGVLEDDLAAHAAALERVGALARRLTGADRTDAADPLPADVAADPGPGLDLSFVDLGGGFGVPYDPAVAPLDLDRAAAAVVSALDGLDESVDVVVEPGRYVAADAGVLLTRVNTVRPGDRTTDAAGRATGVDGEPTDPGDGEPAGVERPTVVGCDAGLHTLVRPAMFGTSHPVRNLAAGTDAVREPATVVGPVCSSADRLCSARPLARPERGALLAVGMTGAYGVELASRFHGRPLPTEVAAPGAADEGFDPATARPVRNHDDRG